MINEVSITAGCERSSFSLSGHVFQVYSCW